MALPYRRQFPVSSKKAYYRIVFLLSSAFGSFSQNIFEDETAALSTKSSSERSGSNLLFEAWMSMAVFRQRGIIGRRDFLSSVVRQTRKEEGRKPLIQPPPPSLTLLILLLFTRPFFEDASLDRRFLDCVIGWYFKESTRRLAVNYICQAIHCLAD